MGRNYFFNLQAPDNTSDYQSVYYHNGYKTTPDHHNYKQSDGRQQPTGPGPSLSTTNIDKENNKRPTMAMAGMVNCKHLFS